MTRRPPRRVTISQAPINVFHPFAAIDSEYFHLRADGLYKHLATCRMPPDIRAKLRGDNADFSDARLVQPKLSRHQLSHPPALTYRTFVFEENSPLRFRAVQLHNY